ncbi:hypothetical protein K7432_012382 [Basidiobolus ranarum]|uniref:Cyclin n=1 Tax=Basidiobolus ranarum TaxID=34480 RepID=A0ABR2WKW2_9FUNG
MTAHTIQKPSVRTSPYAMARRKRSLKNARSSCRETTKRNVTKKSDHRSPSSDDSVSPGPRILSPREQVLAAYAGVYVPKSNHIQAPVLKRLFAFKSIFIPSPRLITVAAKLIQAHWESLTVFNQTPGNSEDRMQTVRSMHLTGYISTTLARSSILQSNSIVSLFPSFPTVALIFALVYVERLKKLHPNARGETGCGHRLFLVSYMVACKYLQGHLLACESRTSQGAKDYAAEVPNTDESTSEDRQNGNSHVPASVLSSIILPNEQWARLSGVFSTPELTRMELELLAFLQFDLYVSYEDFIYHWTKYMDINQLVPSEQLSANIQYEETESEECVVPDF